ncbi:MAG: winged helix-turn-helix domain-containing protein [Mesorhizobium sp.]|nr:MAG: winged helix-turn-helix domain-containing protein [Mesorhizobium sp.]
MAFARCPWLLLHIRADRRQPLHREHVGYSGMADAKRAVGTPSRLERYIRRGLVLLNALAIVDDDRRSVAGMTDAIAADGVAIPLTPMELDLVAAFATRAGQVIGRDELLDLAPPRGDEPFDRSIDSRITRLRRRLEKDAAKPELIKTIRGVGYLYPRR